MRKISAGTIGNAVRKLCIEASQKLSPEVLPALELALGKEKDPNARQILDEIIRNAKAAKDDNLPLCQDTGYAIVFLEIGQKVAINGDVYQAVNEGVAAGYKYLRKSVVTGPFNRKNTFRNTPAIVHISLVAGDKVKIGFLPKGGGAENCSFQKMFLPTASKKEIIDFIVSRVKEKAAKACPPVILGIGIGGTFDYSSFLAKKALTRKVNQPSSDPQTANMEKELLKEINKLGIGPMGLGGKTTVLAVHVETFPCHIASLPVAVNFECHAHRYAEETI